MISVIISTHNRLQRLTRAIESVKKQSYTDWELIIVDDGSTDGTKEYLKTIETDKITSISLPKAFGCDTHPKNVGILNAKGDYISFLDDDNEYRVDHLSILVKELERNPEVSVVYGDRWIVDEISGDHKLGVASEFNPYILLRKNYIDTSDVLIRKSALFYVGGFDERYRKFVDWNLWVRMAKVGFFFKRVPLVITDYHIHNDMKSQRPEDEKAQFTPAWDPFDVEVRLPFLGKIPEPKVAIYSITYDRLSYTKECFASLYTTAEYPFDHYVVDNGSTDGTDEYLNGLIIKKQLKSVLYEHENVGISKASNDILDEIVKKNYDIIIKVDNDCFFKSNGWLKTFVDVYKTNHRIVLSPYIEGLKDSPGGAPRVDHGFVNGELIGLTKHIGGICHFVSADAYKDFRWDEDSFLHGTQDLEFSQWLSVHGYTMGYLENWFAEHYRGTESQHKDFPEYFDRRTKEKTTRYEKN